MPRILKRASIDVSFTLTHKIRLNPLGCPPAAFVVSEDMQNQNQQIHNRGSASPDKTAK